MAGVAEYFKESYIELTQKVTWPTWKELQNSAVLVLVSAIIIALLIFGMDQIIGYLLNQFYTSLA
ncbi:preprotein translocase subunit SecE [Mucilaginibacter pallidiroseus]|uniref:Protein translocase subunit SecE n=1 Tax=Mucilaginibacter pallidiroseus TaxID=2599295 RepID=A0A563UD77_9SPHI|nr:preprotein translocase subunit SecE [Mucilaginibacter pallidiroseus]TWR29229.1 preprotein translocase subunit SecE [Mucilaginibacter pallidiroseus]